MNFILQIGVQQNMIYDEGGGGVSHFLIFSDKGGREVGQYMILADKGGAARPHFWLTSYVNSP